MKDKTETIGLKKKKEYTAPTMELIIIGETEVMMENSEHDNAYGDFGDFWSLRPQNNSTNNMDDYYRE